MKITNLLCKSLFILIIFISFISCKPKTSDIETDDFCVTYDGRPEQSISYKEMAIMLAQYQATREPILKNGLGFEDTREVWFQIDSLKKYLAYVEKLSKDSGVEITGFNFISAAYPDKPIYGNQKNYQTLILNPTTTKGDNPRVSFDPLYSTNGNPAFVSDLLLPYLSEIDSLTYSKKDVKKYIVNLMEGLEDTPSSAMNKGQGSPPN
ncbi:MAG: hypothetical protein COA67_02430 [Lutibacter sp.]|nr:MAG: hypothetical protein COA67_02430 [Lutibacter sp.]